MTAVWLRWWAELKRQAANATPMQILGVVTVVLINVAVFGLLAYIGGDQVLHYIARLATWIRDAWIGIPIMYIFMILSALPPIHGFSTSLTLCGMAFASSHAGASWHQQLSALLYGWGVATIGLMLSAMLSFHILRRLLANLHGQWDIQDRIKSDRRFRALQTAVRERGMPMAILARFCPLPYCYTNLLLASLDSVSPFMYAVSTFATSPRLLLPLFMGAKMYELSDRDIRANLDPHTKRLNAFFVLASIGLAIGSSWYIWRETVKTLHLEDTLLGEDMDVREEERESFVLDDTAASI